MISSCNKSNLRWERGTILCVIALTVLNGFIPVRTLFPTVRSLVIFETIYILVMLAIFAVHVRFLQKRHRFRERLRAANCLICSCCEYDLTGVEAEKCPECGTGMCSIIADWQKCDYVMTGGF